jgi:phage tail-like protein
MTCVLPKATFRLLDRHVGWDAAIIEGIGELDSDLGLALYPSSAGPARPTELLPFLPPPALVVGCDCEVWLAGDGLFRRGPCDACFEPYWTGRTSGRAPALVAVDVWADRVAVASRDTVWILERRSRRMIVEFAVGDTIRDVAWTPLGKLWIAGDTGLRLCAQDGDEHARLGLPPATVPLRIGVSPSVDDNAVPPGDQLWLLGDGIGGATLWSHRRNGWHSESSKDLANAFEARTPTIASAGTEGFCLVDSHGARTCWNWRGCPDGPWDEPPSAARPHGQLLTSAIDSGIRRCRWHRVRADGVVPPGTQLEVAVATAEQIGTPRGIASDGEFIGFERGVPHPLDWQTERFEASDGELDFLIDQPPGRFLFVRIRMLSDSDATPRLRRLRLDFPRSTSLGYLPAVYSRSAETDAFAERFLAMFDATIENLDDAIERMPALLDAEHTPPEVLPWLADLLGIALEPFHNASEWRALVRAAPELMVNRGTARGLLQALSLGLGLSPGADPVLIEPSRERPWGALGATPGGCARDRTGTVQLGSVRLFGRATARLRLGSSPLGKARINSLGDPAADPFDATRGVITVALPPLPGVAPALLEQRAERLLERERPAHTLVAIQVGGRGFRVGTHARIGIDSLSFDADLGVLGSRGSVPMTGAIRLGRSGHLGARHGSGLRLDATRVGRSSALDC